MRREEARQPGVARREQRVGAPLGERRELAQREPEVIERERERLPVEVAARAGLAVVREEQRVVGHRVELALEHALDVVERVGDRAEHLRHAAQRVRILHAAAVGVARDDRAALEQARAAAPRRRPGPGGGGDRGCARRTAWSSP